MIAAAASQKWTKQSLDTIVTQRISLELISGLELNMINEGMSMGLVETANLAIFVKLAILTKALNIIIISYGKILYPPQAG